MSENNKDLGDMADDAMDGAKKSADNLGDKTKDAVDNAKEAADEFSEKASEKFDDAKEATKEFAEDAKEAASDFADEAKKTANEFTENAKEAFNEIGGENKKLLAGIIAVVLGSLGIHKFILGYQKEGIIMLVVTLLVGGITCGIGASLMGIIGLIEGIIYLTKSDEEFYQTYQVGKKTWF
ncbi:NINE protein [Aurantibacter crassamenti]|uniref:NINE protein n=1 Tax=Aurantibacter crassamenti TaxID=1837375 RepID=UPI00193AC64B|nr:NINE protein [Aurantibacter crassamenti]MBM1105568.1 NINE protein [Aurantibacter crassamenti]